MARAGYDVPGLRKALGLIELLCDSHEPLGLSEISRRLGLNKPMVLRILRTLERRSWILRDGNPPRYAISLRPFHHASKPVRRLTLRKAAEGPLRRLWEGTGASTYLAVLDGDKALYLESLDSESSVQVSGRVGGRYELHCSAPGKVLLAHAGEGLFRRLVRRGLRPLTRHTIRRPDLLRRELQGILRRGYAVDLEEYVDGVLCLAVPVFDWSERVVGSVGITVLRMYCTPRRLVHGLGPRVIAAGREISRVLGFPGRGTSGPGTPPAVRGEDLLKGRAP